MFLSFYSNCKYKKYATPVRWFIINASLYDLLKNKTLFYISIWLEFLLTEFVTLFFTNIVFCTIQMLEKLRITKNMECRKTHLPIQWADQPKEKRFPLEILLNVHVSEVRLELKLLYMRKTIYTVALKALTPLPTIYPPFWLFPLNTPSLSPPPPYSAHWLSKRVKLLLGTYKIPNGTACCKQR